MVMTIYFQNISISAFPTFAQLKLEWNSKQIILWHYSRWRHDNIYPFFNSAAETLGPFIRGKIRRVLNKTRTVPFI